MKRVWTTHSADETRMLGEHFGTLCAGGEIVLLESDLGGGKTTFTQGIARGLGVEETVSSPTFTIEQVYQGRLALHHYDLYRLQDLGILAEELQESLSDTSTVKIIEWPNAINTDVFKQFDVLVVRFDRVASSEDSRSIIIEASPSYEQLLEHIGYDGVKQ